MITCTIKEALRRTGITKGKLELLITKGRIIPVGGQISEDDVRAIEKEKEEYISLREYSLLHTGGRFNGKDPAAFRKLSDILEENDWFGTVPIAPDSLLSGNSSELAYFPRYAIPGLDQELQEFFEVFGFTEEEKIDRYIQRAGELRLTREVFYDFHAEEAKKRTFRATPSYTAFVRIVFTAPDLDTLTDKDLINILGEARERKTKELLVRFLNYAREKKPVQYSRMQLARGEAKPDPAYSDDVYIGMARCIFSPVYIDTHDMIKKALDDHVFAEMWLFLSLFYVCGWRGGDVCRGWVYPDLAAHGEYFPEIDPETLYEDLLEDRLSEKVYTDVCRYAIAGLEAAELLPGKNLRFGPTPLLLLITPEMHTFYGMLSLIGECHHLKDCRTGYMQKNRTIRYQNKVFLREFFGDEFCDLLDGQNLSTRRLNKDFLQGVEAAARKTGCGALRASSVASYFRNHTNPDTIAAYLADHTLTKEDAGMVLSTLMERGVFACGAYQLLKTEYSEAFMLLPLDKQTELIRLLNMTPLQIESETTGIIAAFETVKALMTEETDKAYTVLRAMFEITQGRGDAKDRNNYCILRALGIACEKGTCISCIEACCDKLILTRYGIGPLVDTLRSYHKKGTDGDRKAWAVLKILWKRYSTLINKLVKDLSLDPETKAFIKRLTGEITK